MLSNLSSLEALVIGLAVVGLFIVRQLSPRRVTSAWTVLLPLGLAYFGVTQGLANLDPTGLVLLAINTSLAIALGVVRGMTFRIWAGANGQALMQGTALTLLLWGITIAVRVMVSFAAQRAGLGSAGTGGAELLIPVAATIAAQNLVAYLRSRNKQLVAARSRLFPMLQAIQRSRPLSAAGAR